MAQVMSLSEVDNIGNGLFGTNKGIEDIIKYHNDARKKGLKKVGFDSES